MDKSSALNKNNEQLSSIWQLAIDYILEISITIGWLNSRLYAFLYDND